MAKTGACYVTIPLVGFGGVDQVNEVQTTPKRSSDPAPKTPSQAPVVPAGDRNATVQRPAAVLKGTAGSDISFSDMLKGFKAGDKLDFDGPLFTNGSGSITKLDADHLTMAYDIRDLGRGSISFERTFGDKFTLTAGNGYSARKSYDLVAKPQTDGSIVMTVKGHPKMTVTMGMKDGTMTLSSKGMDGYNLPFDITKQK